MVLEILKPRVREHRNSKDLKPVFKASEFLFVSLALVVCTHGYCAGLLQKSKRFNG